MSTRTKSQQKAKPKPAPNYRHYKPKNLAVVRINGHDEYLGRYNSPESKERYAALIAEWRAQPTPTPRPKSAAAAVAADLSISELIAAFLRHADGYYRRADGTATGEAANYKGALRPLRRLYGATPAKDFGPLKLRADIQTGDASFSRLLGLEPVETTRSIGQFLKLIHPDDRRMVANTFNACTKLRRSLSLEFRGVTLYREIKKMRAGTVALLVTAYAGSATSEDAIAAGHGTSCPSRSTCPGFSP